ncbi:hypothetical protein ACP4OV_027065 [Aristida adscensionis]
MHPKDAAPPGGDGDGDGVDRISGLTDRALIRVLSHLPAWEAVRASVLSRRWRERRLWASLACLDIRQPCHCRCVRADDDVAADHLRLRAEWFAAFVKNLLLRRRVLQPINALRLCWSHHARDGDAATWIAHAVRRGATEVELSAVHHLEHPSPEVMSFIVSGDVKTRLKILKLIRVRVDDGGALTVLTSRCTSLEELQLTDCPGIPKIQSTSLKRLIMIRCAIPGGFLIYAPNLVSLQCSRPSGSAGTASTMNQTPQEYTESSDIVSCNLKILKLSHVTLFDADLTQLCSRRTSLEELELKHCVVEGKEIRSTSLKYLTMINCKFADAARVYTPNLVLLRCIRPSGYVPWIQHMEFLATALIELDDSCLGSFFEESDQEDSFLEGSCVNNYEVYDHDGKVSSHSGDEDSFFKQLMWESTPAYRYLGVEDSGDDTDAYNDHDLSEPSDDEDDDRTVCYDEIADDLTVKPYMYKINGCNHSADGPSVACSQNDGSQGYINFGGDDMLRSLSNVKTMDLLAHPGEVLLRRELKQCPEFMNLTTLSLGEWCMAPDLDALATILDRSPNLENLFLHLDMAFNSRVGINLTGSFTCTNLKMVKITCSKCDVMVHKLAEFLRVNNVPHEKIFVCRTPCTANDRGGADSQSKRKEESEDEKEAAKQRKADN